MADPDDTDPAHDHDSGADVGHDVDQGRTTAPMSEYTTNDVGIGVVVFVVGFVVAFGIPLLTSM